MKKALIIAAGNAENIITDGAEFIIAADGGYDRAIKQNIRPDLYVGDGDSVESKNILCEKVKLPTDKDFTDTECAVSEAVERGYNRIDIYGATGTRMDHTLANIFMLKKFQDKDIRIIDGNNNISLVNKETFIHGLKGKTVSFLPADSTVSGVTLEGFLYPLSDKELSMGTTLTVSNVVSEDVAHVKTESGALIMIIAKD